jgi:hypothetical protein
MVLIASLIWHPLGPLDLLSSSSEFPENLNEGPWYATEFAGYFLREGVHVQRHLDGNWEVLIVLRAGIAYKLRLNFEDFVLLKHPPVRLQACCFNLLLPQRFAAHETREAQEHWYLGTHRLR